MFESSIDTVFGVMGEGNMILIDELVACGAGYIKAAREDGAVGMADGYARSTGRLGVCTVTHGPGLTNSVTALTEAVRNGTSMLVIAGELPAADHSHPNLIDQAAVVAPTGAGFVRIRAANSAMRDVSGAVQRAKTECRPIVLAVPVDLENKEIEFEKLQDLDFSSQRLIPDVQALEIVAGIVATSRKPIILAGRGAVRSGAREDLVALANRLGAPLATTLLGRDYFRDHPKNIGLFGTLSSPGTADIISRADCVLSFGAALNQWTTDHGRLLTEKRVVHCDVDTAHIGRWADVSAALVGDASASARLLSEIMAKLDDEDLSSSWGPSLEAEIAAFPRDDVFGGPVADGTVDMRSVMIWLDEVLPAARTVVTDGGHFLLAPWRHLPTPGPEALFVTTNYGSIGLGLANAIGCAVGATDRLAVAVVGDGGLMMSLAELNTAVRHGIRLVVVVLNDGGYGAEYHYLRQIGRDTELSLFDWPDFRGVAESLGGVGLTVRAREDIARVKAILPLLEGPLLIDVKLDPSVRTGFHD